MRKYLVAAALAATLSASAPAVADDGLGVQSLLTQLENFLFGTSSTGGATPDCICDGSGL